MSIQLEIKGWQGTGKTTIAGVVQKALVQAGYEVEFTGECDPNAVVDFPEKFIREKIEICEVDTTPQPIRENPWVKWVIRCACVYAVLIAIAALLDFRSALILAVVGVASIVGIFAAIRGLGNEV